MLKNLYFIRYAFRNLFFVHIELTEVENVGKTRVFALKEKAQEHFEIKNRGIDLMTYYR